MGIQTPIEYCDSSVNAVMGCTGCELLKDHCYARRLCARYAGLKGWPKDFTRPEHFPGRLEKALKWKDLTGTKRPDKPWLDGMPRVIFVNDLSDGFCPGGVDPGEWLSRQLLTDMMFSPHIWLLLTKWPGKMRQFLDGWGLTPNVWLGTTIMRQSDTWRLGELLQIQGGKKWVSAEPLLGALDLTRWGVIKSGRYFDNDNNEWENQLDFIVTGGETGPGARPAHPKDFRSLRNQCVTAGVPYFHKSNGEWLQIHHQRPDWAYNKPKGKICYISKSRFYRIGNKRAGHLLGGKAWRQMPNVAPRNKQER